MFRELAKDPPKTRSACVIVGAHPAQVAALHDSDLIVIQSNRHGTLVMGELGTWPIDYADAFEGPVYDVMWNAGTGWFSVTVYHGQAQPVRFDNRTGDAGYPRIVHILGATTPESILDALDVPSSLLSD